MNEWRALGLMGGSFDPVHKGHVALARRLADTAGIDEVRFVIAASPPHRPALVASASLRCRMIEAAIADLEGFSIEACELEPAGPRYTVDTLAVLRRRNPGRSLCWMMGYDSFVTLPHWRRWTELLDLAHLLVGARAGHPGRLPAVLEKEIQARSATDPGELRESAAGRIMMCREPVAAISSSRVRNAARAGHPAHDLIPAPVARIIEESGAYAGGQE